MQNARILATAESENRMLSFSLSRDSNETGLKFESALIATSLTIAYIKPPCSHIPAGYASSQKKIAVNPSKDLDWVQLRYIQLLLTSVLLPAELLTDMPVAFLNIDMSSVEYLPSHTVPSNVSRTEEAAVSLASRPMIVMLRVFRTEWDG